MIKISPSQFSVDIRLILTAISNFIVGSTGNGTADKDPLAQIIIRFIDRVEMLIDVAVDGLFTLCRVSYSFMIFLGAFLYLSRLQRRLGQNLVIGGVGLILIAELLAPLFI